MATQVVPRNLNETVRQADAIVLGTITGKQSRWRDLSRRWMETDYTLSVEEVLYAPPKGESIGRSLVLTFWGGTLDGQTQTISDMRLPLMGERLVVMLRPGWRNGGFSPLVGFNEGLFSVSSEVRGGPALVHDHNGQTLVLSARGQVLRRRDIVSRADGDAQADLAAFVGWLRSNIASIKAKPSEIRTPDADGDPRIIRPFSKKPESGGTLWLNETPTSTPPAGSRETATPQDEQLSYSSFHRAHLPIVVDNFPDSFAPWSPEDEYQMSKWNYYAANVFRVYTTPSGTYGWGNGRFDLAGWPNSADLQSVYGDTWESMDNPLAVCFLQYDILGWIIEADIALNPAWSWTLDDEWVYDGSTARCFRRTMTHELGHMHGLEHQFDYLSVMNYPPAALRAFSMPFADDAEGIRAEYPANAVSITDLAIYLFYSSGSQSWTDATIPSSVAAGSTLAVNNYHLENVGTNAIATPTVERYLATARNYLATYYYLGTSTYASLNRFSYFDPGSVQRTFLVPVTVPAGNYYLGAYIRDDAGVEQSSFPFSNNYAFSRQTIAVTSIPSISIAATDATAGEPGSGQGTGTFTFSRTGPTSAALTVNFMVGGTATSSTDYSSLGTTVTFTAGSAISTKTVSVIDDSGIEGDETVIVTLAGGTGYTVGSPSSATVTIKDDDYPVITVTATDTTAGEPGTGQGTGTFTFNRTGPTAAALTVNFMVGGTATSSTDYSSLGTTVTFTAGSAISTKTVGVVDDSGIEGDETVIVTLAGGTGYTVGGPSSATVTIKDDDLPVITVTATDATAGEPGTGQGTGTFTFNRTGPTAAALTVNFTAGGTATGATDYSSLGTTVTFGAGSAISTKTVSVIDDSGIEGEETVVVTLASGTGYAVGSPSSATVIIKDDDAVDYPVITALATDAAAGESGTGQGTGTFTISRTGSTASALTVNFTAGGTAIGGSDYASIGTTVAFAAGSATATITVSVTKDSSIEGDETMIVTLVAGTGYTVGSPSSATVTIKDERLLIDFGSGRGLFSYDGTSWSSLSGWDPGQVVEWAGGLAVDFGPGKGLFNYSGTTWTYLTGWNPESMVRWGSNLVLDFGAGKGLFQYNGATWIQLSGWDPGLVTEWAGGLAVDFGAGKGFYNYNGSSWAYLTGWNPENMLRWNSSLVLDFGAGKGLFLYNGTTWTMLTSWDPEGMLAWTGGLAIDFGPGLGLYNYNGSTWTLLTGWNPEMLVKWGSNLVIDFGSGKGLFYYNGASWTMLSAWNPEAGIEWSGKLAVDFGAGKGLFTYDGILWTHLTGWDPQVLLGPLAK